jgi:uncharacterized protein (DUF1697 family)
VALTTHIALLRGVNVGGKKAVPMAALRALAAEIGLGDPLTLLQSGNLVFKADAAPAELEARLQAETHRRLGLDIDFMVRTVAEWDAILAVNPYPEAAERDPSHLLVMALKGAPDAAAVEALGAAIPGRERLAAHRRELYIVYPDGIGASKLTGALIERRLGLRGTARNWNTALKLAALAADAAR